MGGVGAPHAEGAECEVQVRGVGGDEAVDEVDLLQRVVDAGGVDGVSEVISGGGGGAVNEDAPEGAADTPLTEPGEIHVAREGRGECEIGTVDVVVIGRADQVREIVMAVDQGRGSQNTLDSLLDRARGGGFSPTAWEQDEADKCQRDEDGGYCCSSPRGAWAAGCRIGFSFLHCDQEYSRYSKGRGRRQAVLLAERGEAKRLRGF